MLARLKSPAIMTVFVRSTEFRGMMWCNISYPRQMGFGKDPISRSLVISVSNRVVNSIFPRIKNSHFYILVVIG